MVISIKPQTPISRHYPQIHYKKGPRAYRTTQSPQMYISWGSSSSCSTSSHWGSSSSCSTSSHSTSCCTGRGRTTATGTRAVSAVAVVESATARVVDVGRWRRTFRSRSAVSSRRARSSSCWRSNQRRRSFSMTVSQWALNASFWNGFGVVPPRKSNTSPMAIFS